MGAPKAEFVDSSSALDSLHIAPVARPQSQKFFKPTLLKLGLRSWQQPSFQTYYALTIGKPEATS